MCHIRLPLDLMVSHDNRFFIYFKLSLGSTYGHCNFSSAQTGRRPSSQQFLKLHLTLNWPALCEEYAHPLGAGLSLSEPAPSSLGTRRYHWLLIVSIFSLYLYTSYLLLLEDWGLFHIFIPPISLLRNRDFKSDILSLVRSRSRQGFSMFDPFVR